MRPPEEGAEYLAFGDITSYEARGDCQIRVRHLMQEGVGNLRLEFERLKSLLENEGLFDAEHKRDSGFSHQDWTDNFPGGCCHS